MQNQPLADAESAQASSALTDQMIVSRQTQPNLLVIILGTCIITAVVFGCSGYYFGRQSPSALDTQAQVSPLPLNTAAQTEAGTLALQKSYTNKKHG